MDEASRHPSARAEPKASTRRESTHPLTRTESDASTQGSRLGIPRPTPRLDLEAAARLAEDARTRMRESRDQLAQAQKQIGSATEPARTLEPQSGWTQHALVREPLESTIAEDTPGEAREDTTEIIELRAALEIARETTAAQREERRALLAENQRLRAESEGICDALERIRAEHAHAIALTSEMESQRDDLQQAVRREAAAAEDLRLRIRAAEVRAENAEAVVERLRATLAGEPPGPAPPSNELDPPYTGFRMHIDDETPAPEVKELSEATARPSPQRADQAFSPVAAGSVSAPASGIPLLSPIYDAWLDDQIRHHFGAMGLDDLADLVAAPIRRSPIDRNQPTRIVLLGDRCQTIAAPLADALLEKTEAAIEVFALDTGGARRGSMLELASDHPLGESVHIVAVENEPAAIERALREIDPQVLVARSFLSADARVDVWLPLLSDLHERDCDLILVERTARDPGPPPAEMVEIGDRIWELMPERYKSIGEAQPSFPSWKEAFMATASVPSSDALTRIRESFSIELFAQFGYLAEPFVGSLIGENFTVEAARDRRFMRQLADLDDRRIEAGTVRGLHWIAWIARSD